MIATPPSQSNIISINDLIDSTFEPSSPFFFELNQSINQTIDQLLDADSDDLPPADCVPRLIRSRSFYDVTTSNDNPTMCDLRSTIAQTTLLRSMSDPICDQNYSRLQLQDESFYQTINQSVHPSLNMSRSEEYHFTEQFGNFSPVVCRTIEPVCSPSRPRIDRSLDFDMFVTTRPSSRSPRCEICSPSHFD